MESTAINCYDEEKWEAEEEETLSFCDLPVNLVKEENQVVKPRNEEDGEPETIKTEEDFNFGSCGGYLSIKPEMCAADEVFFKGQILPLRHSVSSDSGCRHDSHNTNRCLSRSESMDHSSLSRLTSVSSSSTRSSHYSTSSSNSMAARSFNSMESSDSKSKAAMKIRNNFNTHPSPKPQIRLSKTRTPNVSSRNQKSSMCDFFRLGLVRAPELELQDLKVRSNNNNNGNKNSVSRNNSCNSSNSSSSTKNVNNGGAEVAKNQLGLNKGLLEKRMGLFSGCKCSVKAVETVPLNNIVVTKSNKNSEKEKATSHAAIEEKKKKKQALSRYRTFEWIKELSHASYVDND